MRLKTRILLFIIRYVKLISLAVLVVFFWFVAIFIYRLVEISDFNKYIQSSISLFGVDVAAASGLFSLGRSDLFIKRFDEVTRMLVYRSGIFFLSSAMVAVLIAACNYSYKITTPVNEFNGTLSIIANWTSATFLAFACLLSINGLILFAQWLLKATALYQSEQEELLKEYRKKYN